MDSAGLSLPHWRSDARAAPSLSHYRRAHRRARPDPGWHYAIGDEYARPAICSELFGPGQALDASKYFIVLPDAIGHGKSSKPSDSLRTNFPAYNYEGMVSAQHKLVTEGLGLRRVRLLLGFSMAGMNAWMWGVKTPGVHGRLGPNGLPAEGDVQSQLNDAASHYRQHPQRP